MAITEKCPAVVTNTEDPDQLGRIMVKCADIMGDEDTELPMWIEPIHDWAWFYVPDVGEVVEIEVVTGTDEDEHALQSTLDSLDIKWRGKRFYGNEEGEQPTPVNDEFKTNYGKRRGIATPAGHLFLFDDTEGDEKIRLAWTNGTDITYVEVDKDGKFCINNKEQQKIELTDDGIAINHKDNQKITIADDNITIDQGGTQKITMDNATVIVDHGLGNKLTLGADSAKIELGGETLIMSGSAAGASVKVGGAAAIDSACKELPMQVLWTSQQGILQSHTHPSAAGPTGPPAASMPGWDTSIKSDHLKIP